MAISIKDGAMIAFAAAGIIALTATAEFGLPAIALGTGMSLISGALAVNRKDATDEKRIPGASEATRSNHRQIVG